MQRAHLHKFKKATSQTSFLGVCAGVQPNEVDS